MHFAFVVGRLGWQPTTVKVTLPVDESALAALVNVPHPVGVRQDGQHERLCCGEETISRTRNGVSARCALVIGWQRWPDRVYKGDETAIMQPILLGHRCVMVKVVGSLR